VFLANDCACRLWHVSLSSGFRGAILQHQISPPERGDSHHTVTPLRFCFRIMLVLNGSTGSTRMQSSAQSHVVIFLTAESNIKPVVIGHDCRPRTYSRELEILEFTPRLKQHMLCGFSAEIIGYMMPSEFWTVRLLQYECQLLLDNSYTTL
jgi:hypothetical protein